MGALRLILLFLLVACFSLAAWLVPSAAFSARPHQQTDSLAAAFLGEGRRLFANQLFVKADVYMHSGYYPSIFDQKKLHEGASSAAAQGGHGSEEDYLGKPRDWIDRLGRNFFNSKHTHLDDGNGQTREILPWLRLSASLDPQRPETYTVAAYWLRAHLNDVEQAERFLREGWRENPESYEILYELGRLFADGRKDDTRARNVWELALRKWDFQNAGKPEADEVNCRALLGALARLEERNKNFKAAVAYLQRLKKISPSPEAIELQIKELSSKYQTL